MTSLRCASSRPGERQGVEDSAEHLRRLLSLPEGTLTGLSAGATTAAAGAEPLASSSAPSPFTETTVEVLFGRKLTARTTAEGVAVFEFDELCRRTLGANTLFKGTDTTHA